MALTERNQKIRQEVLLQLAGAGQRIGLRPERMAQQARREGIFDCTAGEAEDACLFLVGQGFAERVVAQTSAEIRYRITSKGIIEHETSQ